MAPSAPPVILLAGGLSRRMGGGDKALRLLAGRPLLAHVIERMAGQAGPLVINANGDPARFVGFGLPVVADALPGHPGPLAGVLTGMLWARANVPAAADIVTVPADGPFLPSDLVGRLMQGREAQEAELACAASGGRIHPVVGLWPVALADALRRAIEGEGVRRVGEWAGQHRRAIVDFPTVGGDPFLNVNTLEDLAAAERLLAARRGT
jgi:molybdenum cofactor guanylyltransferase